MSALVTPTREQAAKLPAGTTLHIELVTVNDGVDGDGDFWARNEALGRNDYHRFSSVKVAEEDIRKATAPKLPTSIGSIIQITKWASIFGTPDRRVEVQPNRWIALLTAGGWHIATDNSNGSLYAHGELQRRVDEGRVEFTPIKEA